MSKKSGKAISIALIAVGAALLIVGVVLFIYNRVYDHNAGVKAQNLLDQFMSEYNITLPPAADMAHAPQPSAPPAAPASTGMPAPAVSPTPGVAALPQVTPENTAGPLIIQDDSALVGAWDSESVAAAPQWTAPSYSVLGIISLPKLGNNLPVIGECSDYLLGISCCRLSGLVTEKPIRLVLAGHNIYSHFKGLNTYQPGDEIAFTSMSGVTYYYRATEITAIHKTGGAEVTASDGWDITLLTCMTDRTMRTMVRFVEITSEAEETASPDVSADASDASASPESAPPDDPSGTAPTDTDPVLAAAPSSAGDASETPGQQTDPGVSPADSASPASPVSPQPDTPPSSADPQPSAGSPSEMPSANPPASATPQQTPSSPEITVSPAPEGST